MGRRPIELFTKAYGSFLFSRVPTLSVLSSFHIAHVSGQSLAAVMAHEVSSSLAVQQEPPQAASPSSPPPPASWLPYTAFSTPSTHTSSPASSPPPRPRRVTFGQPSAASCPPKKLQATQQKQKEPTINVVVRPPTGDDILVILTTHTMLSKLMAVVEVRLQRRLSFYHRGIRLYGHETPHTWSMAHGDVIECEDVVTSGDDDVDGVGAMDE